MLNIEFKETGDFKLTPAGQYQAVCCELIDLGYSTKNYKNKDTGADEPKQVHEISFNFQINKVDDETGKRFEVRSAPLNLVLSEKSNLYKFLLSWRGHGLTADELKPPGVVLDNLVGRNAIISVVHNKPGDKTFANIGSIMPLMDGLAELEPLNYESRQEQFDKWKAKQSNGVGAQQSQAAAAPAPAQQTTQLPGGPVPDAAIPF
jgi:hypothetical protein